MSYTAINVQSLAKRFTIGRSQAKYETIAGSISRAFSTNIFRYFRTRLAAEEHFWALRDISFDVKQGEVVGVIGHNGAGKSTLLKVLSRITEPTSGTADIYGRVGSLLEVGTGFHNELTGRENIYLSGAILGMKKSDIDRRFDEIVAFAEVNKFIDTPVKHYSSGMHLRLAFAVAAHLEPEILLVDEVLAVGDLAFQKKCLNKMENVANEGRTVLFVSHNMGAIKELCHTALVLKNGVVDFHGPVVSGIQHYSHNVFNGLSGDKSEHQSTGWTRIRINGQKDEHCRLNNNEECEIATELVFTEALSNIVMHCIIEDAECQQVVHNYTRPEDFGRLDLEAGNFVVDAKIPPLWLKPGVYTLYLKLIADTRNAKQVKYISERILIDVTDKTEIFAGKVFATILPPVEWSLSPAAETTGKALDPDVQNKAACLSL